MLENINFSLITFWRLSFQNLEWNITMMIAYIWWRDVENQIYKEVIMALVWLAVLWLHQV